MAARTAFGPPRRKRGQKGMFLGGLFGQGSASGPSGFSSTSSNTSTNIDPGGNYYPLEQNILGTGQQILDTGYQPYDTAKRFEGFTPDQLAAQQGIRDAQGNWRPAFNQGQQNLNAASGAAGGVGTAGQTAFNQAAAGPGGMGAAQPYLNRASGSWTDPGVSDQWMNPYTKNVSDATVQQAQEAWSGPGGALQGLSDMFTGGGAAQFGRERMGDVAGKMSADFGRGLSQTLAGVNQQGYNQGMTAFGNEQQRLAGLGQTAGGLGVSDITARTGLGTAQTNAAAQGVTSNINAGQAQTAFGSALQGANYKDLATLSASGQQQQAFGQQQRDFEYQQNREQVNFPFTRAQQAQSLAQGWQLPTSSQSQSWGNQGTMQPTGSVGGNILGAGLSLAGMSTGKNTTLGGDVANWVGGWLGGGQQPGGAPTPGGGPGTDYARGGHLAFGPGGQVPVTSAMRQRGQRRQPAIMARLQAMGGPGINPGQTPGMMPPKPAFASGGHFPVQSRKRDYELYHPSMWQDWDAGFAAGGQVGDDARDREMIRNAVWQHERQMHEASKGELTPLKRFAFGGPVGYQRGGPYTETEPYTYEPEIRVMDRDFSSAVMHDQDRREAAAARARERQREERERRGVKGMAFGGTVGFDDGGPVDDTSTDLGDWYDRRAALRLANQRQRAFESGLRNAEYGAEAESDPAGYWSDLATQIPHGVANMAAIAGLPGSLGFKTRHLPPGLSHMAALAFGDRLPTMEGIKGGLDTAFGEPRTAGGRAGLDVGTVLPNMLGLGAQPAMRAANWTNRLSKWADFLGNTLGLKESLEGSL